MPFLVLALWLGLLTGLGEVAILAIKLYGFHDFQSLSPHAVWMVPLVDAAVFGLAGILLRIGQSLWPSAFTSRLTLLVLGFLASLTLLLKFDGLHKAAAVLLAVGIGVQATRMLAPREAALKRAARLSVFALLAIVLTTAVGMIAAGRIGERARLARLPAAREGAPNVLLIILDTVRSLSLSLYGYDRPTTPELARWAASGVVFDQVISTSPWTLPSHASMFTGYQPHELAANWRMPLERDRRTLAESFAEHGYATAGFVANIRYADWETGLARGFVHYEDYQITLGEALKGATPTAGLHKSLARVIRLPELRSRTSAASINRWFLDWLKGRNDSRPYFAFLNYFDAHAPYEPPEEFRARFAPGSRQARTRFPVEDSLTREQARPIVGLYDGAIAYLDSVLGVLLRQLEELGHLSNTLVIITSDHGEGLAEHGFIDHAASLYRPSLQVPLVIFYPGRIPAGKRIKTPVSLRDLAATVADVAGLAGQAFPGSSLRTHWDSTNPERRDTLVSSIRMLIRRPQWWPASKGDMLSLLAGEYHYIWNQGDNTEELFDVGRDPLEQNDLAATPAGQRVVPAFRQAREGFSPSVPRH